MGSRGRLQFTDTEQKYETGGRVDKEKITRRRQEKKSRGIIEEAERGIGETGSPGAGFGTGSSRSESGQMGSETGDRVAYGGNSRYRGEIPDAADREGSSRSRTGGSAVERSRNQVVRETAGSSGIKGTETRKPGSLMFEENREKPPSKMIHRPKGDGNLRENNRYSGTGNRHGHSDRPTPSIPTGSTERSPCFF